MAHKTWCRHRTALDCFGSCQVGVAYSSVIAFDAPFHDRQIPCYGEGAQHLCLKYEAWTAEEIQASEKALADFLLGVDDLNSRKTEECCHCHRAVDSMEQVGRCVYARPCGCRLWQGTIPEAWR